MKYIIAFILTTTLLIAQSRYELDCPRTLLDRSYQLLLSQVGVKEKTGRNDGKAIEGYLRSVGLGKGYPYCAAGQYWCFWKACQELYLSTFRIPLFRTAHAHTMFKNAARKGKRTSYYAKVHDLIFWKYTDSPSGHTERIIGTKSNGWVLTVGFNTTSSTRGNQRDGGGVWKRQRNILHPIGRMQISGLIGFSTVE